MTQQCQRHFYVKCKHLRSSEHVYVSLLSLYSRHALCHRLQSGMSFPRAAICSASSSAIRFIAILPCLRLSRKVVRVLRALGLRPGPDIQPARDWVVISNWFVFDLPKSRRSHDPQIQKTDKVAFAHQCAAFRVIQSEDQGKVACFIALKDIT